MRTFGAAGLVGRQRVQVMPMYRYPDQFLLCVDGIGRAKQKWAEPKGSDSVACVGAPHQSAGVSRGPSGGSREPVTDLMRCSNDVHCIFLAVAALVLHVIMSVQLCSIDSPGIIAVCLCG